MPAPSTVHFVANCMYGDHVAGGDMHFFHMAQAVHDAGYPVHFFGGHALQKHLLERKIPATQTLTDREKMPRIRAETLSGQRKLLADYFKRLRGTLPKLNEISPDDIAYAATDYWFDSWPVILSKAKRKLMILGMDSPSLGQVISGSRPDVVGHKPASLYYWMSQSLSLRLFQRCKRKRLFYVHPSMQPRLLKLGYRPEEIVFISNGFDAEVALRAPASTRGREFDVVWAGRPHRQKGVDDLLDTLVHLKSAMANFRAVLIGRLEEEMGPEIRRRGLESNVHFAGYVSEEEKFRLFKESRVFLMPSRYESWGIVIAEALSCDVEIVAYNLDAYRPIFGELIHYIPRFDLKAFQAASLEAVLRTRREGPSIPRARLEQFMNEHSWQAAERRFQSTVAGL